MGGPRLADRSPGAKLFVKTGAQVGKADTQVEQQLGLFRFVLAGGDAGGVEYTPEWVAGVGVVVPATSRCKQRVVPAENELKFGLEKVGDHKGGLPACLLGPF